MRASRSRKQAHASHRFLGLVALVVLAAAARANHKDERLGFSIQTPSKWTEVPVNTDDRWMVGKYLSDKSYTWNGDKDGWPREHNPDMQMIAFVEAATKEKAKLVSKEKRNGRTEWVVAFESPFKDYKDFMTKRYRGGGWYVTEEKEDKVGNVPVTCYQIKVDKVSYEGPKRIVTWVYHVPDVDIAVQFEALEDAWPKLQSDFMRCLRSFKSIARSGEAIYEPSTAGDKAAWINEDKLTLDDRKSRRATIEKSAHERATEKLPEGWTCKRMGHFLVMSHTDDKFSKRVADQAEAVWKWLEDSFGFIGEGEYVRAPILRICKDLEEYRAFFKGADAFSVNDLEIVTWQDHGGADSWSAGIVNRRVVDVWFRDRDRPLWLAMPGWLGMGLTSLAENLHVKNGKVVFKKDEWNRDDVREAVREGKLSKPREIFVMSGASYWADYLKVQEASELVDYLAARGAARGKKTKNLLPEYLKNLQAVVAEVSKEDEKSEGQAEKKPKTEAEEDALFKTKRQGLKQKEQRILEDTFRRTFGTWSDSDWKEFEEGYMKAVD